MSHTHKIWFHQSFISISIALFMGFGLVSGEFEWESGNGYFKKIAALPTITVDPTGHGHFSTIQSAIDHVPSDNKNWIRIHIKSGVYREKVTITRDKPFIVLEGEGQRRTIIVWDDHDTPAQSPTFSSFADNFVARGISFKNTYNLQGLMGVNPRKPAVAAVIAGDKSSIYKCGFYGLQDTLWDAQGRHYFRHCHIEGAVDFIFGMGQSIYEKCAISVIAGDLNPYPGSPGYITAQGRNNPHDTNGFVFKHCRVFGRGITYLGRAWRGYSRVIFYKSSLSGIIVPEGWDAWNSIGHEDQITYAEHLCHGLGSNTSERVSWEKKLSDNVVLELTNMTFIDAEGWLRQQPLFRRMALKYWQP
ncbi:hypothetical protein HHK36_012239 [Tetracentron sinense]|uniref:Pectinesterase n=1 Tax=Tetracentron sinense TaxID=13715 RepID=A0A834Z8Y4_TETSI|nr:hypothetical protein HHK36_012239 [Tetracentron sinense]